MHPHSPLPVRALQPLHDPHRLEVDQALRRPARPRMQHSASLFDTDEVNNTVDRLPKREAVANRGDQIPPGIPACRAADDPSAQQP